MDVPAGSPKEARWIPAELRPTHAQTDFEEMVDAAMPGRSIESLATLSGGLRNTTLKLQLVGSREPLVLRIYDHDPSICQKEADVLQLAATVTRVPEVLHVEPRPCGPRPPFALLRYVEGISFHELKQSGDPAAMAEAAFAAGETLACLARLTFPTSGWLGPGPEVTQPLLAGADPLPRFVESCLGTPACEARLERPLRDGVRSFIGSWASRLAVDRQSVLVHGDFGKRNLLVRRDGGRWCVAALIDWEFAVAGSPLIDLGHFMRYERAARPRLEPHFSRGYRRGGGELPDDWRPLSRAFDLIALCASLSHDRIPGDIVAELVELVRATVEARDPRLP
jgi:aminoglycoside phosphotransferase (APT) family kinase protein